ncbi:MAG: hypothetical protein KC478_17595 [Bacteriovoracaceae bacterium]|nr:hypothetical protein [Bacteriovoracaceae bacterium]
MEDHILSKNYELEEVKEILDSNWNGMRELFNKRNSKKLLKRFDNEILTYLAINPAIELLKKLNLFETFHEASHKVNDFEDLGELLTDFLIMGLSDPVEVNKTILDLEGKIDGLTINVPKSSIEIFELGIKLNNCLSKNHRIQKYFGDYLLIALYRKETPVYVAEFYISEGTIRCTDVKRLNNIGMEPPEYYFVAELENLLFEKYGLKRMKDIPAPCAPRVMYDEIPF